MTGLLAMVLFAACTAPEGQSSRPRPAPGPEAPLDTGPPPPSTGSTGDTGPLPTTTDTLDCSALPQVPAGFEIVNGNTGEDFDFDGDGRLCTILLGNFVCRDLSENEMVVVPGVTDRAAGTRLLPTGDWVYADVNAGSLVRVDPITGGRVTIATDLAYPNGVEVDPDNMVYVSENWGRRVRQIDAYTGEQWVVANDVSEPNGLILSPDNNILYIASFGGVIYAVDRLGPHEWSDARLFYHPAGWENFFDGINVDACGNVYVTAYLSGRVYRISADGEQGELLAELPSSWIPNMRWGHDIGGWRTDVLYVSCWSNLYALEMQIPGKAHILAQ